LRGLRRSALFAALGISVALFQEKDKDLLTARSQWERALRDKEDKKHKTLLL